MTHAKNPYGQAAVRSGLLTFLAGRGFSALLTFAVFALAARVLSLPEYGYYAATLALMEMGLALSGGGVDWVAGRLVPEYRIHASGAATGRVVLRFCLIQAGILLAVGAATVAAAMPLAGLMRLPGAEAAFELGGVLIVIEGLGRLSRDQMLGFLMRQGAAQSAQFMRTGSLAILLGSAWYLGKPLAAVDVLQFELIAAVSGALLGAALLAHVLWRLRPLVQTNAAWQAPDAKDLRRMAAQSYASYFVALTYGPQVITILIARFLGVEAVAVFGFARGFADQVRRYLPTDLLQSVVRPALMAYYSAAGDFSGLMLRLSLWLKVSLMVLLPLLVFFAVFGEQGSAALGGARFGSAWPVLLVLLSSTGMMAWRRVSELACAAVMAPEICLRAGLLLLLMPPLMVGTLLLGGGLIAAVALVVVAEAVFCLRVMQLLGRRGFAYDWSYGGFMRLFTAFLLSAGLLLLVRSQFALPLLAVIALSLLVSLPVMAWLNPFEGDEKVLVGGWSPRLARLFGWPGGGAA